jgi:hypothetical protein
MRWPRLLAYITGRVDKELLMRNEYLAAENRILRAKIKGRLQLSDGEKRTLAEIAQRLGRKALAEVAVAARPDTKVIASRFGALLREIVETIDAHGLKTRHLSKHRRSAEAFIEQVVAMKCATESGLALKRRMEKNRNKLFTFLNYDGVPWNNNNAEHAVRAFTRLRNVINTSTPQGTREFATLLSIQQTLRYRGMSLLEFMRSGRMEIDG